MPKYFTPEALEKFKKELDHLENVERKEVAERLRYAASFGDLAENAAYHEAKEAKSFLEGRILELREIISQAKPVVQKENDKIQIGSIILLKLGDKKEKMEIQIVEPEEADPFSGKVSHKSSLGAALLGRKKGDKVKVKTLEQTAEYQILGTR